MATVERAEELGIRPIGEFVDAHTTWPRGDRPAAMREAAAEFRPRFQEQGTVRAIRTVDLASAGYPASFALASVIGSGSSPPESDLATAPATPPAGAVPCSGSTAARRPPGRPHPSSGRDAAPG